MAVRRWHVAVLNGVLVVAAAYVAGRTASVALTAVWAPHDRPAVPARPSTAASDARSARGRARYDVVVSRDLFRTSSASPDAASHLRLVGLATHLPAHFAVIEDVRRGVQHLYRVGDRVGSDESLSLTVARIEPDCVVLESSGGVYVLARGADPVDRPGHAGGETDDAPATPLAAQDRSTGGRALVRRGRDDEYFLDRRAFEATVGDFDRVASQIRVIPNVVGGKAVGYRIFGIDAASVFSDLGLRNGDVLRSVNTVALTDPATALNVLRDLPRERRITLDIDRRQRPQTLTYEIR
jgi:general secretion pathway protein C